MKKILLILIVLVWILSLAILIMSLTNLYPVTVLKENRFIIGIIFITTTGFLKQIHNSITKGNK